jgi:hypothetical protein
VIGILWDNLGAVSDFHLNGFLGGAESNVWRKADFQYLDRFADSISRYGETDQIYREQCFASDIEVANPDDGNRSLDRNSRFVLRFRRLQVLQIGL